MRSASRGERGGSKQLLRLRKTLVGNTARSCRAVTNGDVDIKKKEREEKVIEEKWSEEEAET